MIVLFNLCDLFWWHTNTIVIWRHVHAGLGGFDMQFSLKRIPAQGLVSIPRPSALFGKPIDLYSSISCDLPIVQAPSSFLKSSVWDFMDVSGPQTLKLQGCPGEGWELESRETRNYTIVKSASISHLFCWKANQHHSTKVPFGEDSLDAVSGWNHGLTGLFAPELSLHVFEHLSESAWVAVVGRCNWITMWASSNEVGPFPDFIKLTALVPCPY